MFFNLIQFRNIYFHNYDSESGIVTSSERSKIKSKNWCLVKNWHFLVWLCSNFLCRPFSWKLKLIISLFSRCVTAVSRKDYNEAYSYQSPLVQQWIKLFQAIKDENWLLPVMITVCLDLRCLALKVGTVTSGETSTVTKPREALEKAAEALMNCFRICTADKYVAKPVSKKKFRLRNLTDLSSKVYKFRILKVLT